VLRNSNFFSFFFKNLGGKIFFKYLKKKIYKKKVKKKISRRIPKNNFKKKKFIQFSRKFAYFDEIFNFHWQSFFFFSKIRRFDSFFSFEIFSWRVIQIERVFFLTQFEDKKIYIGKKIYLVSIFYILIFEVWIRTPKISSRIFFEGEKNFPKKLKKKKKNL